MQNFTAYIQLPENKPMRVVKPPRRKKGGQRKVGRTELVFVTLLAAQPSHPFFLSRPFWYFCGHKSTENLLCFILKFIAKINLGKNNAELSEELVLKNMLADFSYSFYILETISIQIKQNICAIIQLSCNKGFKKEIFKNMKTENKINTNSLLCLFAGGEII